jgi:hypothetical protein
MMYESLVGVSGLEDELRRNMADLFWHEAENARAKLLKTVKEAAGRQALLEVGDEQFKALTLHEIQGREISGKEMKEINEKLQFAIDHLLGQPVASLSGGEQQICIGDKLLVKK